MRRCWLRCLAAVAVGVAAASRAQEAASPPEPGDAAPTPAPRASCSGDKAAFSLEGPHWSGWGSTSANTRFQDAAAAGIAAAEVPRLKVKWAFGFPGDMRAYAQPALAGGRIFTGSEGGKVYSLDAATGCVYWIRDVGASVRTAITVAEIETEQGMRPAALFGDGRATVHAVDAATGEPIWARRIDDFPSATITGSPVLSAGRLYVPVSSSEETAAADPDYPCCRFRGSLVALDAGTGEEVWKRYTVGEPQPTRKSAAGVQQYGPSGAAIWSSPAVDPERGAVYVTTGNNYSEPATDLSDAFVAFDLESGRILWSRQMTAADVYTVGCRLESKANCSATPGPDFDFGASPILVALSGGGRALLAGQKSGIVHALDPDRSGRVLWQVRIGRGGSLGGIQWGSAADATKVYVALSDLGRTRAGRSLATAADPAVGGGTFALQLEDGKRVWYTPPAGCAGRPRCSPAQLAAVTAIDGAVFSGSMDGHLRAYSSGDGRVVWDFDTVGDYETVNGVPGRGGSLDGPGPVVGGGMLFVESGNPSGGGIPGNVLLAFSVDGK